MKKTLFGLLLLGSICIARPPGWVQLTTVPSAGGPTNVVNGLVGWWKFDEGTGLVALDSSGNLNAGTINGGCSYVTGQVGPYALSFDGSSGYVSLPTVGYSSYSGDFTICAWVKLDTLIGETIAGWGNGGVPNYYQYVFSLDASGVIYLTYYNGASSYLTGPTVATNVWTHVCVTVTTAGNVTLFANGVGTSLSGTANPIVSRPDYNRTYIGKSPNDSASAYFKGSLDDVRIFNRALSADEVLDLYNFTK